MKQRYPRFGRLPDGTPLVLFDHGQQRPEILNKMRVQHADLAAMARDQGLMSFDQIDYAVLKRNGEIVLIPAKKKEVTKTNSDESSTRCHTAGN